MPSGRCEKTAPSSRSALSSGVHCFSPAAVFLAVSPSLLQCRQVADGVVQRNNEDEILRIFSVNDCNFEENLIAIDGCKSTADAGPRDLLNVAQEIRAG